MFWFESGWQRIWSSTLSMGESDKDKVEQENGLISKADLRISWTAHLRDNIPSARVLRGHNIPD